MDTVGILSFEIGKKKKKSLASASLIRYNGCFFIATAAHCVYDLRSKEVARNITIEVNSCGIKKLFEVPKIVVPEKWVSTQLLTYDYAFGQVKIPESIQDIAFIPKFDFDTSEEKQSEVITLAGYPISLFKSKKKYSQGNLDLTFLKEEKLIGMESKLKSGISGGPWFFEMKGEKIQIGVTSARINSFKNMVWASVWTKETEKVLIKLLNNDIQAKFIIA